MKCHLIVFLLFLFPHFIQCVFYLPGVAPYDFQEGEAVELKVNKLTSVHTHLPYKYYSLPFCQPDTVVDKVENLGEIMRGDRIENSVYKIEVLVNIECAVVNAYASNCNHYTEAQLGLFADKVYEEYYAHWIIDNLPAGMKHTILDSDGQPSTMYEAGFPLGSTGTPVHLFPTDKKNVAAYINNHVDITLLYNPTSLGNRIVGFEIVPASYLRNFTEWETFSKEDKAKCPSWMVYEDEPSRQPVNPTKGGRDIVWTYSVTWQLSEIIWAQRWDRYLRTSNTQVHWFSIINSFVVAVFLSGMVATIMIRVLRADLRKYGELEDGEDEIGWKFVHNDVLRAPSHPALFSVFVGSGAQIFAMAIVVMLFSVLGFLSPANRGGLISATVMFFVVTSAIAGYSSSRLYKRFNGLRWKETALRTAFLFPGVVFTIFLILNIVIWGEKSSGAVPFGTFITLVFLWFGISAPLALFGSYLATKRPFVNTIRTNQIPRMVPPQLWYMTPFISILLGGILPFGAVFIELFYILNAIWEYHFYYIFGFLFLVFIILVVTCAEVTIVLCYFQLCAEDYHWWWRSYLTGGSSAFYVFAYSIFYFYTKLEIERFASGFLYFGYMLIMSMSFFVMTGAIGFYACLVFVRKIYGSLKVS